MSLSINWLSEGIFDSEHKQYVLLAYLQETHRDFNNKLLYPHLADLYNHYISNLIFKNNLEEIKKAQRIVKGFDFLNEKIIYEEYTDEITQTLENILEFSTHKIKEEINFGENIHQSIKEQIIVEKIGLRSLCDEYGLFILSIQNELWIYEYEIGTVFKNIGLSKEIKTTFIKKMNSSILNNPERIKEIYQDEKKHVVNTYLVYCEESLDIERTILPVAKEIIFDLFPATSC